MNFRQTKDMNAVAYQALMRHKSWRRVGLNFMRVSIFNIFTRLVYLIIFLHAFTFIKNVPNRYKKISSVARALQIISRGANPRLPPLCSPNLKFNFFLSNSCVNFIAFEQEKRKPPCFLFNLASQWNQSLFSTRLSSFH